MKTDEEIRHENAMVEIETERKAKIEVEKIKHENRLTELRQEKEYRLEVERVKSAEIRRSQERKGNKDFAENYWKG